MKLAAFWGLAGLMILPVFCSAQHHCSGQRKALVLHTGKSPGYSPLEDGYDVKYYFLNLSTDTTSASVKGNCLIVVNAIQILDTFAIELNNSLSVDSVFVNGTSTTAYQISNDLLFIALSAPVPENHMLTVNIFYNGSTGSKGFFTGLNRARDFTSNQLVTYTLSEPFQAKDWFPCKQDLNDKADSVRVHITVPQGLMAGSNGLLQNVLALPDGKLRYEWKSSYPIAYYLISFAVSNYIDYSFKVSLPGIMDSLLVQNFIYRNGDVLNREKSNIDATGQMLRLFTGLFGPYPFAGEKYGHCMAPMGGGMEHQTMTTLQNFNFELVAHELAHQWFGNQVTCGTWQDIWINEGFASYSEFLALEFLVNYTSAQDWMADAQSRALLFSEGSVYLNETEARDEARIFNYNLSYKKGATILHMLRYEINNDEVFFKLLKDFQIIYSHKTATAKDFNDLCNALTGLSWDWFFEQWYYGRGYPLFNITSNITGNKLKMFIEQKSSSSENQLFKMHLDVKVVFEEGSDTLLRMWSDQQFLEKEFSFGNRIRSVVIDPLSYNLMRLTYYEIFPSSGYFQASPNPFTSALTLFFTKPEEEKEVSLNSLNGKLVYKKKLTGRTAELELSKLSSGVYIINVTSPEGKIYSSKLIKAG